MLITSSGSVDPNTADFQIVTRTVTFTGDQQVACTGIPITDDTKDGSREDFEVFLEAPSNVIEGDPSVATVTIVDDDGMRMFCPAVTNTVIPLTYQFLFVLCKHARVYNVTALEY